MSNMKFISIRKFGGLSWEVYKNKKNEEYYTALCHDFNKSVESSDWNELWSKIIDKTKEIRKKSYRRK